MGKSSLPRARTRGRHRRVEPKTWQHATPPRVIGYAVAVFLTVIAVSSAYHRADAPQAAPASQPAAAQPAAQFLAPQITATVPDLAPTTPEPRLLASETPAPAPAKTPVAERQTEEAQGTAKAPKPTAKTSAPAATSQPEEPSRTTQPADEPAPTTQPAEPPSETAPPSQSEPPSSSKPERPGPLPAIGGIVDGLTGPLLKP
ncbi:hypothetical protein SAMN05216215_1019119 [Saccharopolyspora shandongensis]|uniref:Uncharacterized protein n=1 Tax=Saccharopolyspora shandongensis TaxID=418495 RepID=A0A1H3GWP7_9PSEU|nr:hypothetical protein SAMN05216215_1019119 [Saccharopolyspora shandongensis]